MRLEPLCRFSMRYERGSWHRPYGEEGEGLGYGQGSGEVAGELEGTLAWANYPRRRHDGVWTPNLRGVLTLQGGDELLVSVHGQSVEEDAPGHRRAILARVELTTEAEPYRWLNTCFLVARGRDRRGARALVAGRLGVRERGRPGPPGARGRAAGAVPSARRVIAAARASRPSPRAARSAPRARASTRVARCSGRRPRSGA